MSRDPLTPARPTPAEIEHFVSQWACKHVSACVDSINLLWEIDRLAAGLTLDARSQGISGGDIHRVVGDIDVYLMEKYEQLGESDVG